MTEVWCVCVGSLVVGRRILLSYHEPLTAWQRAHRDGRTFATHPIDVSDNQRLNGLACPVYLTRKDGSGRKSGASPVVSHIPLDGGSDAAELSALARIGVAFEVCFNASTRTRAAIYPMCYAVPDPRLGDVPAPTRLSWMREHASLVIHGRMSQLQHAIVEYEAPGSPAVVDEARLSVTRKDMVKDLTRMLRQGCTAAYTKLSRSPLPLLFRGGPWLAFQLQPRRIAWDGAEEYIDHMSRGHTFIRGVTPPCTEIHLCISPTASNRCFRLGRCSDSVSIAINTTLGAVLVACETHHILCFTSSSNRARAAANAFTWVSRQFDWSTLWDWANQYRFAMLPGWVEAARLVQPPDQPHWLGYNFTPDVQEAFVTNSTTKETLCRTYGIPLNTGEYVFRIILFHLIHPLITPTPTNSLLQHRDGAWVDEHGTEVGAGYDVFPAGVVTMMPPKSWVERSSISAPAIVHMRVAGSSRTLLIYGTHRAWMDDATMRRLLELAQPTAVEITPLP